MNYPSLANKCLQLGFFFFWFNSVPDHMYVLVAVIIYIDFSRAGILDGGFAR